MKNADKIAKIAFIIYAVLMIWLLFGQRIGNDVWGGYSDKIFENLNLIPFETIGKYVNMVKNSENGHFSHHAIINLAGNIIMFVPLGLLLPFVTDKAKRLKKCLVMSLVILLCVEVLQLVTLLGSFDVDDIILNISGVFIGWMIYGKMTK